MIFRHATVPDSYCNPSCGSSSHRNHVCAAGSSELAEMFTHPACRILSNSTLFGGSGSLINPHQIGQPDISDAGLAITVDQNGWGTIRSKRAARFAGKYAARAPKPST
jgi:hypothetical protein